MPEMLQRRIADGILGHDVVIEPRTEPWIPLLGSRIDLKQPKTKLPALVPLEVIDQAPVEIASNVETALNEPSNRLQGLHEHPRADPVRAIRNTVFEHINGLF